MKQLFFAVGGFFAIALLVLGASSVPGQYAGATSPSATVISAATTTTSVSVTSSTRVLATTTNLVNVDGATSYTRVYATICNPNANPVYINLDRDRAAAIGAVTYIIAAAAGYDACFEITDRNLYSGSITASSTNQTATVINVKDYVQ